jgi:hypothetical protein
MTTQLWGFQDLDVIEFGSFRLLSWLSGLLIPDDLKDFDDEGSTFLQNVGNHPAI